MAAPRRNRSKPSDPAFEKTRAKIQASQLVNRLQKHGFGEVELSNTQVKAIQILLDKSLPNLQAIQLTGEGGGPVQYANMTDEQLDQRLKELEAEEESLE